MWVNPGWPLHDGEEDELIDMNDPGIAICGIMCLMVMYIQRFKVDQSASRHPNPHTHNPKRYYYVSK